MKTRPRNCSGVSRSSLLTLFKLSLVVSWLLLAGGLAWGQNQAVQPPAAAGMAQNQEAKYQAALAKGQEAQRNYFFVTALMYYQQALKLKPGDEVAMKLQSEMRAKINARASGATVPSTTTAPPVVAPPVTVPSQTVSPPATRAEQPVPPPGTEVSPPAMKPPPARKHEVSASGDFFYGQGNVSMPFGFSLGQTLGAQNFPPTVAKPDRTSDYYGGTLSYGYGQAWYLDLGYAQGSSSGDVDVQLGGPDQKPLSSAFTIKDDWYQAYIRYTFPGLRNKPLWAYLRAGVSYVQADMTDYTVIPNFGIYNQTDKTEDLLGNLGFGVGYKLYTGPHFRLGLQVEGEGFYGSRTQKSLETLPQDFGVQFQTVTIDNTLYGGTGRATLHFEYRFGATRAFRVFTDGGVQARFTFVTYPSGLGTFDELLWGPYIKLGLLYAF
jgi:hypothetical protein